MANDASLPVRRAGLAHLKGDAGLTAADMVLPEAIHPQAPHGTPEWPFVKWGSPSGIPIRAQGCVDGIEITVAVHGFSKGRWAGGTLIESAEDHAARIGAAIASALDGKRLSLNGSGHASFVWTGPQLLQDGAEADAFHTVQNFRVRVIA